MTNKKMIKFLKEAYVFYGDVELNDDNILINKNSQILDSIENLIDLIEGLE